MKTCIFIADFTFLSIFYSTFITPNTITCIRSNFLWRDICMEKHFKKMIPKSIVLPSLVMTISYKNTKKKSISTVLIENESDIDRARKIFENKYISHNKDSINRIELDMYQYKSPFVGIDGVDFNDNEELDDLFFTFKIEYNELKNGCQE